MLSGVSVTCFTASYLVALSLETTRLAFRSGTRGALLLGFAGAGLFAHTVFLANRMLAASQAPLSSQQDWYLVLAWFLSAGYLYMTFAHRRLALGVFVLPLVLTIVAAAVWRADDTSFAKETSVVFWGMLHGLSLMLGALAILAGFVFGVLYLIQAYRLKRMLPPPRGLELPTLEWLQRRNRRSLAVSAIFMLVGVLSGIVLNEVLETHRMPWHDPTGLATVFLMLWLAAATLLTVFYRPARAGRRPAHLAIASFGLLLIVLGVGLFAQTQHGSAGGDHDVVASDHGSSRSPQAMEGQP